MQHGAPVESVLLYPGGGAIVSAGGPTLKVWDILSGGRCIQSVSNHQKTITSLCFDSSASRLVTGSLDQHVKIYNVQDYKVVYSIKYPAPVMSVGLSPDDSHLVVGMANGLLSIRQRQVKAADRVAKLQKQQFVQAGTYKYFMHGQSKGPGQDDFTVEYKRKQRLAKYDKYLKKFEYHNALDEVLLKNKYSTQVVVAMLQELVHRSALVNAISGRDDVSLEPLVRFLVKHIHNPRYTNLLVDVSETLLGKTGY